MTAGRAERRARVCQALRHGDGEREQDKGRRIVDGDDGQQRLRHGALRAVLLDDHDGRSRSRGCRDRAQHKRERQRLSRDQQAEHHKYDRKQRFEARDDDRRNTDTLEIGHFELITDGESNEAQRHIGNDIDRREKILRQQAEDARPDEKTRHKIARHVRQMHMLCHAPAEHARKDHDGQVQQGIEIHWYLPSPSTYEIGTVKRMPLSG